MSRHASVRSRPGGDRLAELASRGILIFKPSVQGVAEEAAGVAVLACKVARLEPLIMVKG